MNNNDRQCWVKLRIRSRDGNDALDLLKRVEDELRAFHVDADVEIADGDCSIRVDEQTETELMKRVGSTLDNLDEAANQPIDTPLKQEQQVSSNEKIQNAKRTLTGLLTGMVKTGWKWTVQASLDWAFNKTKEG